MDKQFGGRIEQFNELLSSIGVGIWDWNLQTNHVVYSEAWAQILGYTADELAPTVTTWEKMLLSEDLAYADKQILRHLSGESPLYEAEFRMRCRDGRMIWVQDKGLVCEYDAQGKPLRFMGVLQNVTRLKEAELQLLDSRETLDLAVEVASLGTWDWDIPHNHIQYNDEYLRMLGYTQRDMTGSLEEWEATNHPDDLPRSMQLLQSYLAGELPKYECEIRMRHCDGSYIWTQDVGKIVARDADGNPTRIIGAHLNIDKLKRSENGLTQALAALEDINLSLENEVERRTAEVVEQDKMLRTVNKISRKLLTFAPKESFEVLVQDCLRLLGESISRNRVYIWKDRMGSDGVCYCTQIYEWVWNAAPIQGNRIYEEISYADLPAFEAAIDNDCCLNSLLRDLSDSEKRILKPQGIKTILIAPIAVGGKRWGFIGVDNCQTEQLFTSIEENMLLMSGSMLANTIEKMDAEEALHEMEKRTELMLNATPLCCILWTKDFHAISCNDEAVRLFGLSSQQEYLLRFYELSPERQPDGSLSSELVKHYISKTLIEGYCRFEWLHQKMDGTPIPAEITLVRIQYQNDFIVASYTRDLREQRAMLAALRSKEDDLRTARDEALLSSKAKSNFLANMSHEIRTPMNAISGLAELTLRDSENPKISSYAAGIKNACGNLLSLINDILDISKIESGKLEVVNAPYELASLLNDVISLSRVRLDGKPLMFVTDIDSRLPAHLVGDEIRIKQILINILNNAIKFTNKGFIHLQVSGTVEDGRAMLHFSVIDSGIGIKTEDLVRLFAEFERVNTTKNRTIEGTGLGLAISKQLCEMMGGTIEVESIYGKGSEFTVTLPQECPDYEPIVHLQEPKSVLMYEPRERYRFSIVKTLENLGCSCVACANQSELYDNLNRMEYDFILTAALHLEKVQTLVHKNRLTATVAAFADIGGGISEHSVYTMLFPVNCLQIVHLLNGQLYDDNATQYSTNEVHFTAPTARVLLVDDNIVNLQVAAGLMEPYQFIIDTAQNGIEAVKKVQSCQYDLVFMDHMMPEMDGIDATAAIRGLGTTHFLELPIVALTANALVGTREMFIREGMNDFLAKPIEMKKLIRILHKWLPADKVVKLEQKKPARSKNPTDLQIEGIHVAQGIASVGGSKESYLHILASYCADSRQKCTSLPQHLAKQDMAALRTEVHALKSTSATIGAPELAAMAAALEAAAQKDDVAFVTDNLKSFLAALQTILDAIQPVLASASPAAEDIQDKPDVGPALLTELLDALNAAAQLVNINMLEAHAGKLSAFTCPPALVNELSTIQTCIDSYDYDGILEAVARIRADNSSSW